MNFGSRLARQRVNELEMLRDDFKKIVKDSKENLISLIEIDLKACKFLPTSGKLTMPSKLIIYYTTMAL